MRPLPFMSLFSAVLGLTLFVSMASAEALPPTTPGFYATIQGIPGDSQGLPDAIDLEYLQFELVGGVDDTFFPPRGVAATVEVLEIGKFKDRASEPLLREFFLGNLIPEIAIRYVAFDPISGLPVEAFSFTLSDVYIVGHTSSSSQGENVLLREYIKLLPGRIEYQDSSSGVVTWDFQTNSSFRSATISSADIPAGFGVGAAEMEAQLASTAAVSDLRWGLDLRAPGNQIEGHSPITSNGYGGSGTRFLAVNSWTYSVEAPVGGGQGGGGSPPRIVDELFGITLEAGSPLDLGFRETFDAFLRGRTAQATLEGWALNDSQNGQEHKYTIRLADAFMNTFQVTWVTPLNGDFRSLDLGFQYNSLMYRDELSGAQVTRYWADNQPPSAAKGPTQLELAPPTPNPSFGSTSFAFRVPQGEPARLALYDVRGREVAELFAGEGEAQPIFVEWNGLDRQGQTLARGIYHARLTWPGGTSLRPLSLVD